MNEEIYEGSPAKEDVLIGTDSGYNRYRRPDGSTYVHYPYNQMATVAAYSAKDKNGQSIRTADGKLITGKTQAEADRNRFRYDMNHWVEANRRKTAHLPEGWRERIVTPDMNTFNAITGGVFNLTPIQVGRGVYNLSQGKDPGFILGNSGIVSEEYAQEHPWLALGANVLGEGLTNPLVWYTGGKKIIDATKPIIKNSKPILIKTKAIITEPIKNTYNRYTAPKTNIKVAPFKGDNLELIKTRLNNGGFEKLGINADDVILISNDHPLAHLGELKQFPAIKMGNISLTPPPVTSINTRLFLNKLDPTLDITEDLIKDGNAFYSGSKMRYYSPLIGKMAKADVTNPKLITAHEFQHAIDHVNLLNSKHGVAGQNNTFVPKSLIRLAKDTDKVTSVRPPGIDLSGLPRRIRNYFVESNYNELKARFAQLRNYYGITDANQPLTLDQWNYARRHYVKDVGYDNNMQQFFRAVKDPKAFLDHMNPIVPGIAVPAIITTKAMNNDKKDKTESKKQGGKLIKRRNIKNN